MRHFLKGGKNDPPCQRARRDPAPDRSALFPVRGDLRLGPVGASEAPLTLCCVILTMGNRPVERARAIDSVRALDGEPVDLVVVGNGADLPALPADATAIRLPENVGVSEGRNIGVAACTGDVILFLDDDAWYHDPAIGEYVASRFAADPKLAVLAFHIIDPAGGPGARWHVPRLRAGDP